jgi:hypothetical protein
MERLVQALRQGNSAIITRTIRDLESEAERLEAELDGLLEKRAAATPALLERRVAALEEALTANEIDRTQANLRMRECFSCVVVDYRSGQLELAWKHGGASSIMFAWPLEEG